jgi:integrase
MAKPMLKIVPPIAEPDAVARTTPLRRPNKELRAREYLVPQEVDSLMEAAKRQRNGHRDATMLLIAYRRGLRACELVDLTWSQIDFDQARLACRRAKRGTPSTHPIQGDTLRALRRLRRESPHGEFVFTGPRGAPLTTSAFAKIVENAGKDAELPFKAHPHMLRHAAGYKLANDGVDTRSLAQYLGHRNLQNTARYTELASNRFDKFWR